MSRPRTRIQGGPGYQGPQDQGGTRPEEGYEPDPRQTATTQPKKGVPGSEPQPDQAPETVPPPPLVPDSNPKPKPVDEGVTGPLHYVIDTNDAIDRMKKLTEQVRDARPDLKENAEKVAQALTEMDNKAMGLESPAGGAAGGEVPKFEAGDRVIVKLEEGTYYGQVLSMNPDGTYKVSTDQAMSLDNVPANALSKQEDQSFMTLPAAQEPIIKPPKKDKSQYDKAALEKGIPIEMEHTSDRALAENIVMNHLDENPDYYKDFKPGAKGEEKLVNPVEGAMDDLENVSSPEQTLKERGVAFDKSEAAFPGTDFERVVFTQGTDLVAIYWPSDKTLRVLASPRPLTAGTKLEALMKRPNRKVAAKKATKVKAAEAPAMPATVPSPEAKATNAMDNKFYIVQRSWSDGNDREFEGDMVVPAKDHEEAMKKAIDASRKDFKSEPDTEDGDALNQTFEWFHDTSEESGEMAKYLEKAKAKYPQGTEEELKEVAHNLMSEEGEYGYTESFTLDLEDKAYETAEEAMKNTASYHGTAFVLEAGLVDLGTNTGRVTLLAGKPSSKPLTGKALEKMKRLRASQTLEQKSPETLRKLIAEWRKSMADAKDRKLVEARIKEAEDILAKKSAEPKVEAKKKVKAEGTPKSGYTPIETYISVKDHTPQLYDVEKAGDTVPYGVFKNTAGKLALISDQDSQYEEEANDEVELNFWKAVRAEVDKGKALAPKEKEAMAASISKVFATRVKANPDNALYKLALALEEEKFMGAALEHPGFIALYEVPGLPEGYTLYATPWLGEGDTIDVQITADDGDFVETEAELPFPTEGTQIQELVAAYKKVIEEKLPKLLEAAKKHAAGEAPTQTQASKVKASAFDEIPEIEIGGGMTARRKASKKKKEAKEGEAPEESEIELVDKEGKVIATYPDAFGDDTVLIIKFLRQVHDIKEGDDKKAAKEESSEGGKKKESGDEGGAEKKPKALPFVEKKEKKEKGEEEMEASQKAMELRIANIRTVAERLLRLGHIQAKQEDIDENLVKGMRLTEAQAAAAKRAVDGKVLDLLAMKEDELLVLKASLGVLRPVEVKAQSSMGMQPLNISAAGVIEPEHKDGGSFSLGHAFGRGFRR